MKAGDNQQGRGSWSGRRKGGGNRRKGLQQQGHAKLHPQLIITSREETSVMASFMDRLRAVRLVRGLSSSRSSVSSLQSSRQRFFRVVRRATSWHVKSQLLLRLRNWRRVRGRRSTMAEPGVVQGRESPMRFGSACSSADVMLSDTLGRSNGIAPWHHRATAAVHGQQGTDTRSEDQADVRRCSARLKAWQHLQGSEGCLGLELPHAEVLKVCEMPERRGCGVVQRQDVDVQLTEAGQGRQGLQEAGARQAQGAVFNCRQGEPG